MSRGYVQQYHPGEINRCPGCGGTHWLVGRITAECAEERCGTPLFLKDSNIGSTRIIHNNSPSRAASAFEIDV